MVLYIRETINTVKRQPTGTGWKSILSNYTPDKRLISRIFKEL
jgi:hypothetical protein